MEHLQEYSIYGKIIHSGESHFILTAHGGKKYRKITTFFFMDRIIQEEKSSAKLQMINDVGLYIKIRRLSDIAMENDFRIQRWDL